MVIFHLAQIMITYSTHLTFKGTACNVLRLSNRKTKNKTPLLLRYLEHSSQDRHHYFAQSHFMYMARDWPNIKYTL